MSELILRCGCEDGGDCTKITICQAESFIEELEAQVDRMRTAHKTFAASVALLPVKSEEREIGMSWLRFFEQALQEKDDE